MTIHQQLACAQRELGKRRAVYPKFVSERKLTQAKADEEIAGMTAIVATLTKMAHLSDVSDEMRGPITEEPEKETLTQAKLL